MKKILLSLLTLLSTNVFADVIPGYPVESISLPHVAEPLNIQRLEGGKIHIASVPQTLSVKFALSELRHRNSLFEAACTSARVNIDIGIPFILSINVQPLSTKQVALAAGVDVSSVTNPTELLLLYPVDIIFTEDALSIRPNSLARHTKAEITRLLDEALIPINTNKKEVTRNVNLEKFNEFACDLLSGNATIQFATYVRVPLHTPETTETLNMAEVTTIYNGLASATLLPTNVGASLGYETYKTAKLSRIEEKMSKLNPELWGKFIEGIFDFSQSRLLNLGTAELLNVTNSIRQVDLSSHTKTIVVRGQAYAD